VRASLETVVSGEGTALGEAVVLALRAAQRVPRGEQSEQAGKPPPASVLLISDGAQTQGQITPAQAATRARDAGVPVYTISLGTPDGVVERQLPGGFTERVRVPPDPASLRQLAAGSGGEYFPAPDENQLKRVYEELGSRLGTRERDAEITVAFAAAGMAFLLAAGALSTFMLRRLP
jgi:Ca-activated chloride channel family protein